MELKPVQSTDFDKWIKNDDLSLKALKHLNLGKEKEKLVERIMESAYLEGALEASKRFTKSLQ